MKKIFIVISLLFTILKTEAQSSVFVVVDSLLEEGNYQKALTLLENTVPKTFLIFEKSASIYQSVGSNTKALECLNKALEFGTNESIKVKLAQLFSSTGFTTKAVETYESLIEKDTSNLLVANSLGKLYLSLHQAEKAEKIYRYLIKMDTVNPNYPYQLAESLEQQNKFSEMGQRYLDAYNLDTLHIKSIYGLANFFKTLKFKDSTSLFIDKGLKIDSNNINFNQLKANDLYFSKDFNGALTNLKKLDSLNFRTVQIYEMFGMCYYNLQDFEQAEIYFRNAIKLDPNDPQILYRLASLYYDKKDNKMASFYLYRSISSAKPDLDQQYYLLGVISKEENNLKAAIDNFEKSYKNNYENHKALFELAVTSEVYFKDKKIALKHYQNYLDKLKSRDNIMTAYAEGRIKEIKKQYFIEGEIVD
ncbi:MAG: tetratricopeptide repeat protein [Gelidibacter sp.]|nr:tetratricopeptide repeat protein [Gelidibacter sp.]